MANPLLHSLFSSSTRRSLPFQSTLHHLITSSLAGSFSATSAATTTSSIPNIAFSPSKLGNVAVIAHVDHGKTTLMDRLPRQCGADIPHERAMDSISLERVRGITISSKFGRAIMCSDATAEAARYGFTAVDRPEVFLVLAVASLGEEVTEIKSPPEVLLVLD